MESYRLLIESHKSTTASKAILVTVKWEEVPQQTPQQHIFLIIMYIIIHLSV